VPGFGRAKRCLVLYVYGAWSQLDTFDPKPAAPAEVRGEFSTVASAIPGVRVCEHLPRSGRVLDRCALIRSMSHPWNIHSAAYTLTGNPDTERIEGRQRHPEPAGTARVDEGLEVGPATRPLDGVRRVLVAGVALHGRVGGELPARGEAEDANAIGLQVPVAGPAADEADGPARVGIAWSCTV
jgi:hypothetical protein